MLEQPLIVVSLVASALYGAVLVTRPISGPRTAVKTVAVGALALQAYLQGEPLLLIAALALSALGDAFMAGDPDTWLPFGLAGFLAAHLLYIWLFVGEGGGRAVLAAEPWRLAAMAAAVVLAAVMLAWLWKSLGRMAPAVVAYVGAIAGMVLSSLTLPISHWPAMAGAVLFLLSDALLSAQLFKGFAKGKRWADYAVWWLYYGGQAAIAYAFLR